jgi:hypothetical protein
MEDLIEYHAHYQCGPVEATLQNSAIVHASCHCDDCRDLLDIPFHAFSAWNKGDVIITKVKEHLSVYKHPSLEMTKFFCTHCGETVFNTNVIGWRIVSDLLISKCTQHDLPLNLRPDKHFFYELRAVNIEDDLPKFYAAPTGPSSKNDICIIHAS